VPIGRGSVIATWVVAGAMVAALLTAAVSVGGIDHLVASADEGESGSRMGWHDLWWAVPLALFLWRKVRQPRGEVAA